MKKFKLFKMLAVLIVLITSINTAWAGDADRTFNGTTDKLFINNVKPDNWDNGLWAADDSHQMMVYLVGKSPTPDTWCTPTQLGSSRYGNGCVYSITPPEGTYSHLILTRGDLTETFTGKEQTANIRLNDTYNHLTGFNAKDGGKTWNTNTTHYYVKSDGSATLYFNMAPSSFPTWICGTDGNQNFAYFFNGSLNSGFQAVQKVDGNYYKVVVPEGTWSGVILSRHSSTSPTWENKYNQTGDLLFVTTKNYISDFDQNSVSATWSNYVPSGTILFNSVLNDNNLITAKPFTDGDELEINLPKRKTIYFKIWVGNGSTGQERGLTDANCIMSNMSEWGCSTPGTYIRMNTAGAGKYTFTYNTSTHRLAVAYPEVTHPNADYVYLINYGWATPHLHFPTASTTYSVAVTSGGGQQLAALTSPSTITNTTTNIDGAQSYFYAAVGDYPQLDLHNSDNGANESGNKDVEYGKRLYNNGSSWGWATITFGVTLNTNGGEIAAGYDVESYTFGTTTALPTSTYVTKTGYTFDGWYDNSGLTGVPVTEITETDNTAKTFWAKWNQIMVEEIELDHTSESLYKGETLTITPTVTPATALDKAVTWESSAPGVATVNSSGVVTAVAPGTTTITATAHDGSGVTATCTITVGYKLTYDANGAGSGSAPTDATYYANNGSVTVLGNTGPLSKDGYTFRCWNTQANGLGTDYAPSSTYTMTDNTTLYAKWTNDAYADKYTFHYETAADTWSIEAFTQRADGRHWDIKNFVVPNHGNSLKFYVGYEGWPSTTMGESAHYQSSRECRWDEQINTTYHYGYMSLFAPSSLGSMVIAGDTRTAVGAKGTLTINTQSLSDNLGVGFQPSGYRLTIKDSEANTRTFDFTQTDNEDIWETAILNTGLTEKELDGTFKVSIATADSYVDCYLSDWIDTSYVNANKDEYDPLSYEGKQTYPRLTAGAKGRFQLVLTSQSATNYKYTGVYNYNKMGFALRYVPLVNWTITYGYWDGGSGVRNSIWSLGHQPTIDEDVVIYNSVTVNSNDAQAKRVRIDKSGGGYHRLTINSTGGLLVAEDIKAKHAEDASVDGEGYAPTNRNDLQIETDGSGNGALICGGANTTTEATYHFYSKSWKYGSWFVNQYVGIPFKTCSAYDYYGMNIYEYDADNDSWKAPGSSTLESFTCYNMINKYNGATAYYYIDGILELPGTSGTQLLECGGRYTANGFDGKDANNGDYMFANSWTAPISIKNINSDDYTGLNGEVHIFNAGYVNPSEDAKKEIGDLAGQWTGFSFNASSYIENAVIPATQAFCVTATAANATLTLKYDKHVYTPASSGINTFPTRAPRRTKSADDPNILRVIVRSDTTIADNIYLFERTDFTNEYDNGWDCMKWFGNPNVPQLYAIQGGGKVSISAIPELEGTLLGFKAGTDTNSYTFDFEYNDEEPLYLYDQATQEFTQIDNEATYSFTTNDTAEHERFIITRSNVPQIITGYEEIENEELKGVEKFIEDNTLFIRRGDRIYNATGALVK